MVAGNTIARVGIDASPYSRGLDKLKRDTVSASKAMSKEVAAVGLSQAVAKAQPGTTVKDRVGSLLQAGGAKLITDVDVNNIAEARRQMQDIAAVMTKLEAIGAAAETATGMDAEKYRQLKSMYEGISASVRQYDATLQEQIAAQKAAQDAALEQALAQETADAQVRDASQSNESLLDSLVKINPRFATLRDRATELNDRFAMLKTRASSLAEGFRSLRATEDEHPKFIQALENKAKSIRHVDKAARSSHNGLTNMVRSLRNIGLVSVGLRIAGAAFGRLRSIVSEYISSNEALQAQVNGLKTGLGQALAPAINMVIGLFSQLMPYVLGVANAIGSLIGTLFGGAWNKAAAGANKTAAATGSAAKAQKELNNQLLGFDQITRLDSNDSSSGGGGGGSGVGISTIEAKTPAWLERFKTSFTDLFNSDEFKAANIGGKIGMSLQNGIDFLGNGIIKFDWRNAGRTLRENLDSFLTSGWIEEAFRAAGMASGGLVDLIIGYLAPELDALTIDWKNAGWDSVGAFFSGIYERFSFEGQISRLMKSVVSPFFEGLSEYFRENGHQGVAGFFQGLSDMVADIPGEIKKRFVDPIVNWVKNLLGIHSPSTVFADIAGYCVEGFTQRFAQLQSRITDKFTGLKTAVSDTVSSIKNAFNFNWQLPQMKLPHIKVDWVEVGGLLSKFLGISSIPQLSVQWFAKGGILDGAQIFGGAGGTLFGGGEAGREAVLPLDSNTDWMDKIADKVVAMLMGSGDVNLTVPIYLDGKLITTEVIRRIRNQSRASGQPAAGY